jgi:hypothetical protein
MKTNFLKAAGITASVAGLVFMSCQKNNPSLTNSPSETESIMNGGVKGTQTAQNIMIDIDGPTEFVISGNQVWHYNQLAAAKAYFGYDECNAATSGSGNGNSCRAAAMSAAQAARCSLWAVEGHPGWTMTHENLSSDSSVAVSFNTIIAGESFMKGGQFNNLGKYSFTMKTDSGASRLTNLGYSVDGGSLTALTHTIVDGNSTSNNCWLGLMYNANNGPYGNSAVYSYLKSGQTIQAILTSDDATSNDAGCPAVSIGEVEQINVPMTPGTHVITVSATVKGNSGLASVTILGSRTIHISAESCQND